MGGFLLIPLLYAVALMTAAASSTKEYAMFAKSVELLE
jgi:hypothetical protein